MSVDIYIYLQRARHRGICTGNIVRRGINCTSSNTKKTIRGGRKKVFSDIIDCARSARPSMGIAAIDIISRIKQKLFFFFQREGKKQDRAHLFDIFFGRRNKADERWVSQRGSAKQPIPFSEVIDPFFSSLLPNRWSKSNSRQLDFVPRPIDE